MKKRKGGGCKITNVNCTPTVKAILPKLTGPVTAEQKDMFNKYMTALKNHETGHYNFGIDAANKIDEKLTTLPEMTSCDLLKSSANTMAKNIIKEFHDKELQYDMETEYGKNQGRLVRKHEND